MNDDLLRAMADRPLGATGVGSMPGESAREAVRVVVGELPDLPHLPELPARGVGADLTGRSAAVLVDLFAEVRPSGWRFCARPGRDHRRAVAWLREDLDALEEFTQGLTGPLKIQVAGPWTLASTIELDHGDKALSDPGACRDLTASLVEGVRGHVAEVRRRVPGADLVLQLDEPALPEVLAGVVPTASGFGRLRAVGRQVARQALHDVVDAAGVPVVVHCCAPDAPVDLLREAGAYGVSLDLGLVGAAEEEQLGAAVEAGLVLYAGLVPPVAPAQPAGRGALAPPLSDPAGSVKGVKTLWHRLGFRPEHLARAVVVTPTCGLAGADPDRARRVLRHGVEAARVLAEAPEQG